MFTKLSFKQLLMAAAIPAMAFSSCSSDDPDTPGDVTPGDAADGKFVFATTVKGSTSNSYVLLTGETLADGSLSPEGNGLINDGATQWVFYRNFLYGLQYNQGNAGATRSYILNADGNMEARSKEFKIQRFSSYGAYDDDIITMSTGAGPKEFADAEGNLPMTLLVTYLDVYNETTRTNDTSTGLYSMENFLGNGEYVTLSGAEQSGSLLYCGAVPMGLSPYGSAIGDGKYIRPGYEHLVHTESGGTGGGSYQKGELNGTQWPNECWVAIYKNSDFQHPTLAKTDRISTPTGRFRSQYYQTVWAAENGDIYVFSASSANMMTDSLQKTDRPAGVCRIPKGKTEFDDYYCNIEAQSTGGNRTFMRCWPAGGNYFLMVMYDRPLDEKGYAATELAIFDADNKKLTYVTGLPANVSSVGKNVLVHDKHVYIPVNVEGEHPAIYDIDPATASASKGLELQVYEVTGFGHMTPNTL